MNLNKLILQEFKTIIKETPDNIKFPDGKLIRCEQSDAYAFIVDNDDYSNVFIGDAGKYHFELQNEINKHDPNFNSVYHGRIWLDTEIITFWNYPDVNTFNKIMKGLELALRVEHKINIDIFNDNYLIEVYTEDGYSIPIPVSEYMGRTFKEPERIIHNLSVTEKQRLKELGLWKAYNTLYINARKAKGTKSDSAAEYNYITQKNVAEQNQI